ncbi:MAG: carbon-nitrogen hydrolase, partial [Thermomonas sp.]
MSISHDHKPRLLIRPLEQTDFAAVAALSVRVYGAGYSQDMVRGQLGNFPEGQFVAECDGKIVGHCATFRIDEATAMAPHSWREITA